MSNPLILMRKLTQVHGLHPALQRSYCAELNAFIVQDPTFYQAVSAAALFLILSHTKESRNRKKQPPPVMKSSETGRTLNIVC